jgi:hypothetical protein
MSTYLYLVCEQHDPPLRADDESGQHLYDLPTIRKDLAGRDELVRLYREGADFVYFTNHTARFLSNHPKCPIGIVDEYGDSHSTVEEEA